MDVVLGERNKGMNGMTLSLMFHKSRLSRFGSRGSLRVFSCRAERACEYGGSEKSKSRFARILRAYFRKRIHSSAVGSLLKVFQIEWVGVGKTILFSLHSLCVHPSSRYHPVKFPAAGGIHTVASTIPLTPGLQNLYRNVPGQQRSPVLQLRRVHGPRGV